MFDYAGTRGSGIEFNLAAEKICGIDIAQFDRSVGKCRLLAAASVTDWSGLGSGRLRTDFQQAALDTGDAASTRAYRRYIVGWDHERELFELRLIFQRRHSAAYDAGIGARAAYIDGNDVGAVDNFAQPRRSNEAAGGTGEDRMNRCFDRIAREQGSPTGARDVE